MAFTATSSNPDFLIKRSVLYRNSGQLLTPSSKEKALLSTHLWIIIRRPDFVDAGWRELNGKLQIGLVFD